MTLTIKSSAQYDSMFKKFQNYYTLSLPIGHKSNQLSPVVILDLVIDSASNYTWIPTTDCLNHCHTTKLYPYEDSIDSNVTRQITNYSYHKGFVQGNLSTDTIFIDGINNQTNFNFLAVFFDSGFYNLNFSGSISLIYLVEYLFQYNQVINSKTIPNKFAFLDLNFVPDSQDNSSIVLFGLPEHKKLLYSSFHRLKWNMDDFSLQINKFKLYAKIVNSVTKKAIIDTSTPFYHIPFSDMKEISKVLSQEYFRRCGYDKSRIFYCILTSDHNNEMDDFPSIQIQFDKHWIEIINRQYVIFKNQDDNNVMVYFPIIVGNSNDDDSYWILGNAFLNDYYMIMNFDDFEIGFLGKEKIRISGHTYGGLFLSFIIIIFSLVLLIFFYNDYESYEKSLAESGYSKKIEI